MPIDPKKLKGIDSVLKNVDKSFKLINDDATEVVSVLNDISNTLKETAKNVGDLQSLISLSERDTKKLASQADKMRAYTKDTIKDKKIAAKFEKELYKTKGLIAATESTLRTLQKRRLNATKDEVIQIDKSTELLQDQLYYSNQTLDNYQKLSNTNKELNKSTKWMDTLSSMASSLPGVGPLISGPFKEASQAMRTARLANDKFWKVSAKGAAKLGEKLGPAFIIGAIIKGNDHLVKMQRNLQMSTEEAHEVESGFKNIAMFSGKSYLNQKNLLEATNELATETGVVSTYSDDILTNQVFLTKQLGMSGKSAAKFAKYQTTTGKSAKETNLEIADAVANLKKETGIAFKLSGIFDEVANTNAGLKAAYGFENKLLAEQVIKTKQLGINMEQAEKIASGMLDFESSIQAELEAELLTGKSLNLEEARRLALMGKSSEAAALILDQVGSTEDLMKMGVIQQQALAKAVGMERNELIASVKERETLVKIGGKSVKAQLEAAKTEEEREAIKKRIKNQGGEELLQQYEITSAAEDFQAVVIKIQAEIQRMASHLEPALKLFSKILGSAGGLYTTLGLILTVSLTGMYLKFASMIAQIKMMRALKKKQRIEDQAALALEAEKLTVQNAAVTSKTTENIIKTEGLAISTTNLGVDETSVGLSKADVLLKKASNTQEKIGFMLKMKSYVLAGRDLVRRIGKMTMSVISSWSGIGPWGVAIGVAAAAALAILGYSYMSDGAVGPGGEMILNTPKGSIQFDKDDTIIAGTDLGGKKKGNKPNNEKPSQSAMNDARIVAKLDQLIAATKSGKNITMAGDKVNTGIQNETYDQA